MDNSGSAKQENFQSSDGIFSGKNLIITILSVLLFFSFLGINILDIVSNFLKIIVNIFGPLVNQLMSLLGYTTGTVLNTSADVISDGGKFALDIAEGTVQNVGNLMIKASKTGIDPNAKMELDNILQSTNTYSANANSYSSPSNDISENPIQKPISSNKTGWCLVGEYKNKRGCIEIGEHEKCMSGQVFPEQQMCLNPNVSY